MKSRRFFIACAATVAAVGGGVAIAASGGDNGKEVEDAILNDAAERLDVGADDLRNALSDAELAQIDKAVEEGDLTEEQAKMIKEHMQESDRVLGIPPGGPDGPGGFHGPGGFGFAGPGGPDGPDVFDAIAEELGISTERLHRQLFNGKSLRQIANANDKTLADVKGAARSAIEQNLDEAVKEGDLTEEQANQIREDLPEILDHIASGPGGPDGGPGGPDFRGGPGFGPPGGPGFGAPPREFSQ